MEITKFFDKKPKLKAISLIFSEIALDGLVLNFLVFCVFHIPFTWYSWVGWGFIPYVLGEVLPRIFVKFRKRVV